jgi:transposase-like protein
VRGLIESGSTLNEFAAELGVNPQTLSYWKWRLGKEAREAATAAKPTSPRTSRRATFVEVTPSPTADIRRAVIEVALADGVVVRVPDDFNAETLRRLVAALRSTT